MDTKTEYIKQWLKEKKKKLFAKKNKDTWIWKLRLSWEDVVLTEESLEVLRNTVMKELKQSEDSLSNIFNEYADVKKAYLDNEKKEDPLYVDYNLLFNNVDMMMALWYANEMTVKFKWSVESDMYNADIVSKTAEHDYKWEMWMDLKEYELGIDKFLWWCSCVIWDWRNDYTQSPDPIVAPVEFFRPDPRWWWSADKYRFLWFYWYMTKYQMKEQWFKNVDKITEIDWKEDPTWYKGNNGTNIELTDESADDDFSLYKVYNHFRTDKDWSKWLITLSNNWSLVNRVMKLNYKIWGKYVFPISIDFWRPMRWFPLGIRLFDLWSRKQRVLSLLLNLAVKKSIISSLGNHIVADEKSIKNKSQLAKLTEFPEIILVDTYNWTKSVRDLVGEIQKSPVPADNYNISSVIKNLNYEETSIWPNQLWISSEWDQTATEIRDMASNSNIRLSLTNRVNINFYVDFWRKWYMMYQYHYKTWSQKQVLISRDIWDKYFTFDSKYIDMSQDPRIDIRSKFDLDQESRKVFTNHVALHNYLDQLSTRPSVPLSIRLSLREAYRLLWYSEEKILWYVEESVEEQMARDNLLLLNENEELEPLNESNIDEMHEDFLYIYKTAKLTKATKKAIKDRQKYLLKRKLKERKEMLINRWKENSNESTKNMMISSMIAKDNAWWATWLEKIQA